MPTPLDHSLLKPPSTLLKGRYVLMAVVAHVLLVLTLSANFHWRSETPPPTQAELWQEISLPTLDPTPTPPRVEPAPTPPPRVEPAPPPVDTRPTDADIAVDRERPNPTPPRVEPAPATPPPRVEQPTPPTVNTRPTDAAIQPSTHQQGLDHLHNMLGESGQASNAYSNRLAGIVRRNVVYSGDRSSDSTTRVYVQTDAQGNITTVQIAQSSGITAWDDAVVRALWKTAILPPDVGGRRPVTRFYFNFRPRD